MARLDVEAFKGLILVEPPRHVDGRGFFSETYNRRRMAELGFDGEFVQDNHSLSAEVGVMRGLHFQKPPFAQDKLVRVARGRIIDVVVDIRRGSPTYGHHAAVELSAENWRQLLVPMGFAHGFMTLEPDTEVLYKVTAFYAADHEAGLLWNDPALGIAWPIPDADARLSQKDSEALPLAALESPFAAAG